MVVVVLGASGRTGRLVVHALARTGWTVRAGMRNWRRNVPGRVITDLTADPDALVSAFLGADAVINTSGAACADPGALALVDRDGAIAGIHAAERAGVRRFVQLSAMYADAPDQGDRLVRSILVAKQVSDNVLARSSLVWTIVRAGTLTDEPGTGRVTAAVHLVDGHIPRADIAAVLARTLVEPATENRGFDVHSGDVAIPVALAGLR
jgi:uncharacterized protein YbjT (DUF2867 family)